MFFSRFHALKLGSRQISIEIARAFVRSEARVSEIDVGLIADQYGNEVLFCGVGGMGKRSAGFGLCRWRTGVQNSGKCAPIPRVLRVLSAD